MSSVQQSGPQQSRSQILHSSAFSGGTGKTVNDKGTRDALTTAAQKRHIDEFFFLAI